MKINFFFFTLFLIISSGFVHAQIGIGTLIPDASAILDLSSTTKGMLLPRMTTLEQVALLKPAKGLVIFNTTTNQIENNIGDGLESIIWVGTLIKQVQHPWEIIQHKLLQPSLFWQILINLNQLMLQNLF